MDWLFSGGGEVGVIAVLLGSGSISGDEGVVAVIPGLLGSESIGGCRGQVEVVGVMARLVIVVKHVENQQ